MTTKRKPYKTYTREFKLEAIRLMESSPENSGDSMLNSRKSFGGREEKGLKK